MPETTDTRRTSQKLDKRIIDILKHAIAKESGRYAFNRICVDNGELVATDGHCLVACNYPNDLKNGLYNAHADCLVEDEDAPENARFPQWQDIVKKFDRHCCQRCIQLPNLDVGLRRLNTVLVEAGLFIDVFGFEKTLKAVMKTTIDRAWIRWQKDSGPLDPVLFVGLNGKFKIKMALMPYNPKADD